MIQYLHRRFTLSRQLGLVALAGTLAMSSPRAHAAGDSATKFNVFVPANVMSSRLSYLVVTNVAAVTNTVDIEDDGTDGDTDDSAMGVQLAPGDSYVIRIRDGAVNDDAGGKWDGDYFKVRASHPVVVSMGSGSSWQHDFVPSVGRFGIGTTFHIYSLPTSGANADLNVFSYRDNNIVTLHDITTNTVSSTGKATVNLAAEKLVLRSVLNQGEDLNVRKLGLGLDALQAGHSYLVRSAGPITVMTGHLGGLTSGTQARDGGGFVPSANGSSLGSLFFFGIPHDLGLAREKELRVVCPSAATVALYGANHGSTGWSLISQASVAAGRHLDFVGASSSGFMNHELYQLTVSPPYLGCNLYEANWMETGNLGTSDSASVVSSDEGQGLGYRFTAYMGPPGLSKSALPSGMLTNNPSPSDGYASHLWIYASRGSTTVTVKDLDRSGALVNATFSLNADQFYDFVVDRAGYQSLSTGGNRPYLRVESDQPVTVVSGNVNDNWLTYFHSLLPPTPEAKIQVSEPSLTCGGTATVTVSCSNAGGAALSNLSVRLGLPPGLQPVVGTESETPTSSGNSELLWTASSLDSGSTRTYSVQVSLNCTALGCEPSGLSTARLECRGQSAGEPYAASDTANLSLLDSSRLHVDSFTATDDPDYLSATPNPKVQVSYVVSGSGGGTVALQRVVNSALPDSSGTTLLSQTGAQSNTVDDPYTLHYEETRFYRLRITESSCVRTFGPIAVRTSSGQSGGFVAGLESNGRLAGDLAARAIARSTWSQAGVSDARRSPPSPAAVSESSAPHFLGLLPQSGPNGARRVDVTPTDLPDLTNAKSVASADYLDSSGQRVGSVLLVETVGEYYEHSKILCDRAGGSVLDQVDGQSVQPDGAFLRTSLRNERHRTGESAVEFKLLQQPDGSYRSYAAWLQEDYPTLRPGQRVLNVQAWSMRPGYELALASDLLQGVPANPPETVTVPTHYFRAGRTLGRQLEASVHTDGSEPLSLLITRLLPSGAMQSDEQPLRMESIQQTFPAFLDATVELVDSHGKVVDRMWMSDGAWTRLDDSLWGGKTQVIASSTVACELAANAAEGVGELALSGCASLSANVAEFAGVARHIGGGFAPLDIARFQSVSFAMRSNRPVRVCLESAQIPGGQQPCADIAASPKPATITLPIAAFVRPDTCGAATVTSLDTVSFVTREPGALDLAVADLRLHEDAANSPATLPCQPSAQRSHGCGCTIGGKPGPTPPSPLLWLMAVALLSLLRRRSA